MKFHVHGVGQQQQVTPYNTVLEHVTGVIQKSYDENADIVQSLRDLKEYDLDAEMPAREIAEMPTEGATVVRVTQEPKGV